MQPLKRNVEVGAWILDKELGAGGQGSVWKVRYSAAKHSPPAALKIALDSGDKGRARFQREVELLRSQQDPGIIAVRDSGEFQGYPFFVMELASTSLNRVVRAETAGTRLLRESPAMLLSLLRQACGALGRLHSRSIIHRDIKPSNLLLMIEPPEPIRAVLADLGIAVLEAEQGQLTATHEVVGTPIYRAPEALLGTHSPASDVYSFGKTLEFIFAGGLPSGIGPGRCSRTAAFSAELWDHLDELLAKSCAFSPAERFRDASELFEAIPETMVVGIVGQGRQKGTRSDVTLSAPEVATLVAVIAQCPAQGDWVSVDTLRREAGLSAYRFSLALRRLVELALLESAERNDQYDRYTVVRPTAFGVEWAHSHPAEVDSTEEPAPVLGGGTEDEIPF